MAPMLPTDCQAEGMKTSALTAVPSENSPREKRLPTHQSAVSTDLASSATALSETTGTPTELASSATGLSEAFSIPRICLEADQDKIKPEKPDDSESIGLVAPMSPLDSIVGGLQRQLPDGTLPDRPHADWNRKISTTTAYYGHAEQTLIFLDWDDTLFPTTDLQRRMVLERYTMSEDALPADVVELLAGWRVAVYTYLVTATKLSARCVIVTNARRPWIDTCCKAFAPELLPMVDEKTGTVGVVYANEVPLGIRRSRSNDSLIPTTSSAENQAFATQQEKLTKQKQAAMQREAIRFYSQYPGQTWKNIFSIGDMHYEHDALQEVTFTRRAPHEREQIRTKAVLVPSSPAVAELTLRLRFGATVLPAYIKFDGDIDVDLKTAQEPYKTVMKALGLTSLAELDFPSFAWGRGPSPSNEEIQDALQSLEDRLTYAISTDRVID